MGRDTVAGPVDASVFATAAQLFSGSTPLEGRGNACAKAVTCAGVEGPRVLTSMATTPTTSAAIRVQSM